MPFEKIKTKRKSVYAAEQFIRAIKSGTYKVGDKLPPERVLAEKMGISRPSIREALSALQIAGIIESRAGDGTYVRKIPENADIESQILLLLEKDEDPAQVLEARNVLEPGIVKLAVERVKAKDIEKMERILAYERKAAAIRDYDSYVKADRNFHLAIATASRNPLLVAAIRPLIEIMGQRIWGGIDQLYLFNDKYIAQTLNEHKEILDAVKERNVIRAVKATKRHLNNSRRRLLGEEGGDALQESEPRGCNRKLNP